MTPGPASPPAPDGAAASGQPSDDLEAGSGLGSLTGPTALRAVQARAAALFEALMEAKAAGRAARITQLNSVSVHAFEAKAPPHACG